MDYVKTSITPLIDSILDNVKDASAKEAILNYFIEDVSRYMRYMEEVSPSEEKFNSQIYAEITQITDETIAKGKQLEHTIGHKVTIKKIKEVFRTLVGNWAYKGIIVKRGFEKPRGYPGDYKILEWIYDNVPLSKGPGLYYDTHFLDNEYAAAVRNRKDKMKEILANFVERSNLKAIRILNIACGSCRELKQLFTDKNFKPTQKIEFNLVDQDEEALGFCKGFLKNSPRIAFNFLQQNVFDYIKNGNKYSEILGKQDLVYSIGLTDYLPDRVLKSLLLFFFNLLEPGGQLIIAHKDIDKCNSAIPDWFCDWTFYPRNENDLLNLIDKAGLRDFKVTVEREPSKVIFFVTISKVV